MIRTQEDIDLQLDYMYNTLLDYIDAGIPRDKAIKMMLETYHDFHLWLEGGLDE